MLYVSAAHSISDGNISSTNLASIPTGGIPTVLGLLATSPGTDLTASIDLTIQTPVGNFLISEPLFPGRLIPIVLPLIFVSGGALGYSVNVAGTNGAYQLLLTVKD